MKASRIASIGLFIAILAAPAAPLVAQEDVQSTATVAVLDFTGFMMEETGGSAPLGKAVSSMLITEFLNLEGITILERQDLGKLLQEQRLAMSGVVDESTAIEVGQILGVQYVVLGAAVSVAGDTRLDMRVVDVETSEIPDVQKLRGRNDELLDMLTRAAERFGEKIGGENLRTLEQRPAHQVIPAQATIELARGLDLEDKGDLEGAMSRFCLALNLYEEFRDARRAVRRLTEQGIAGCTNQGGER